MQINVCEFREFNLADIVTFLFLATSFLVKLNTEGTGEQPCTTLLGKASKSPELLMRACW